MTQSETTITADKQNEGIELGPFTTAKRVRDSVLIRKRSGNLVEQIFIDEDDWEAIGSLFKENEA